MEIKKEWASVTEMHNATGISKTELYRYANFDRYEQRFTMRTSGGGKTLFNVKNFDRLRRMAMYRG